VSSQESRRVDPRRHLLRRVQRLLLAFASARFPSVADSLLLVPAVTARRALATDFGCLACRGQAEARKRPAAFRGHRRRPERESERRSRQQKATTPPRTPPAANLILQTTTGLLRCLDAGAQGAVDPTPLPAQLPKRSELVERAPPDQSGLRNRAQNAQKTTSLAPERKPERVRRRSSSDEAGLRGRPQLVVTVHTNSWS
jgi:hypothetical protein